MSCYTKIPWKSPASSMHGCRWHLSASSTRFWFEPHFILVFFPFTKPLHNRLDLSPSAFEVTQSSTQVLPVMASLNISKGGIIVILEKYHPYWQCDLHRQWFKIKFACSTDIMAKSLWCWRSELSLFLGVVNCPQVLNDLMVLILWRRSNSVGLSDFRRFLLEVHAFWHPLINNGTTISITFARRSAHPG